MILGAGPAAADPPATVVAAVAADPACAGSVLQASAGGWIAVCGDKPTRVYFARRHGAKVTVTRLLEQPGAVDYDVRPNSLNAHYRVGGASGGVVERSWDLTGAHPQLPDEIRRGVAACSAAQIGASGNWLASGLSRWQDRHRARDREPGRRRVLAD